MPKNRPKKDRQTFHFVGQAYSRCTGELEQRLGGRDHLATFDPADVRSAANSTSVSESIQTSTGTMSRIVLAEFGSPAAELIACRAS